MSNEPHEIILDHLRVIRADISKLRYDIHKVKDGRISIRSDLLRHERALSSVEVDIERIKARLDLSESV